MEAHFGNYSLSITILKFTKYRLVFFNRL